MTFLILMTRVKFTIVLICQSSKIEKKVPEPGKRFDKKPINITCKVNRSEHQFAIGCLTNASVAERPNFSSAKGIFSQHIAKPGKDWEH